MPRTSLWLTASLFALACTPATPVPAIDPTSPPRLELALPAGVAVTIDGAERGITPLGLELEAGAHAIIVATHCANPCPHRRRGSGPFEALVGRYEAYVGEHHRWVRVDDREELSYPLRLSAKHAPTPEDGTLAVQVWEGTEPVFGAFVVVSDPTGAFFDSQPTDELGAALFELPPGEVRVDVEDRSHLERVEAERTVRVDVQLGG